jgi:glutaredoxin
MSDMECPYCGAGQEVCHDDGHGYAEDVLHDHECSECGKNFVFRTQISFDYTPSKADCLNGADHELVFRKSWPHEYSRMGCKHCDFARRATPEERADAAEKGN